MKPVALLSVVLLVLACTALMAGQSFVPPAQVLRGIWGGGDFVISTLRGPRVCLAIAAGASLGMAGALMQAVTRNPLATPDVIGLVQSAGLGHIIALLMGSSVFAGELFGIVCALTMVSYLARHQGPVAFVLYGIAIGATATAVTTVSILRAPDAVQNQMILWLSGSLARAQIAQAELVLGVFSGLLIMVIWQAHRLSTLWLGDEVMQSLGINLSRMRLFVLGLVCVLTASATLAVGPISFLAFCAAPLARAITGAAKPALFPAALMGACLLTAADLVARLLAPIVTLPTGLMMTMLGAPYLIWFLAQQNNRENKKVAL